MITNTSTLAAMAAYVYMASNLGTPAVAGDEKASSEGGEGQNQNQNNTETPTGPTNTEPAQPTNNEPTQPTTNEPTEPTNTETTEQTNTEPTEQTNTEPTEPVDNPAEPAGLPKKAKTASKKKNA